MDSGENRLREILREVITDTYYKNPVMLSELWESEGEKEYIDSLYPQYERILLDFNKIFHGDFKGKRVLEISSFLGVVDIVLAKTGCEAYTYDIPEFQNNQRLSELYAAFHVHSSSGNIRHILETGMPWPDNYFDAVILSEVIEHLNINPLPLFQEIHRILKKDGILYITTPNQVRLINRIALALGRSIRNPISHYCIQLDRKRRNTCGIHWREYTLEEVIRLLEETGFSLKSYSYCPSCRKKNTLSPAENFFIAIGSFIPGFREAIIVISRKEDHEPMEFRSEDEYIKYVVGE